VVPRALYNELKKGMRRLILLALLLLAWAAPARAQDAADRAWAAGDVAAATPLYEARLAADSADATALHRVALSRAWAERYDESLALFDRLLRIDPTNREARVDRARVLAWRGDPAAAALALDPLLAEEPGYLPALQARAQFESWAGNYDEALATYGRIQEITPEDRTVGLSRARVLSWASRFDAAVAAYDSILRQNPRDTEALVGLGTVLAWASRLDSAEAVYRRVLEIEPGNAEAMRGLARAAAWSGRLIPAEQRWREVLARNPNDAAAWVGLSQTLRWQGRDAGALDAARRAVAIAPTDRDAREALRWARLAVAPRVNTGHVAEWDSDGNDITTTSASYAARSLGPGTEVRLDLYRRLASLETRVDSAGESLPFVDERTSHGVSGTLWVQTEAGLSFTGTLGASFYDVDDVDPIPTYRLGIASPGGGRVTRHIGYAHYALDGTAVLIQREVYVDEFSAGFTWTPAQRWAVTAATGAAWYTGRVSGEKNQRGHSSAVITRRISGPLTLGVGFRGFVFQRDLEDGYFDPDFYGLWEATARWLREWRHWSVNAEVAPGIQQVRFDGTPGGSLRGAGSVAYVLSPGRRIVLNGTFANSGINQLSADARDADYRYRAVSLSGMWTF
jgi:tetratricopeptide (TPR) repeat protein